MEEYCTWHRSIPDNTEWILGYSEPTEAPVPFLTTSLLIAPLPEGQSNYQSYSSRLNGFITIVHGQRLDSGPSAQEISIPRKSLLYFASGYMIWVADTMAVGTLALVSTLICFTARKENAE